MSLVWNTLSYVCSIMCGLCVWENKTRVRWYYDSSTAELPFSAISLEIFDVLPRGGGGSGVDKDRRSGKNRGIWRKNQTNWTRWRNKGHTCWQNIMFVYLRKKWTTTKVVCSNKYNFCFVVCSREGWLGNKPTSYNTTHVRLTPALSAASTLYRLCSNSFTWKDTPVGP